MQAPTSSPPLLRPAMANDAGEVYLLGDQILGRGDEIVKYVLLVLLHAGFVPGPAVFAAAAQIGHGKHASHFQPDNAAHRERGRQRNVESAIAVQSTSGSRPLCDSPFLREMNIGTRVPSRLV